MGGPRKVESHAELERLYLECLNRPGAQLECDRTEEGSWQRDVVVSVVVKETEVVTTVQRFSWTAGRDLGRDGWARQLGWPERCEVWTSTRKVGRFLCFGGPRGGGRMTLDESSASDYHQFNVATGGRRGRSSRKRGDGSPSCVLVHESLWKSSEKG